MANDELDDLLIASMKTLDDQVPSGYFEGLPSRILARLEDRSMQTSSSGTNLPVSASGPIPTATSPESKPDKDEDSGLHDIRNLASSARCDALVYNNSLFNQYARIVTGQFSGNLAHIEQLFLHKRLEAAAARLRARL